MFLYCLHTAFSRKTLLGTFSLLLLLSSHLIPTVSAAQQMDLHSVAQKLQETYESANNLVANFSQTTSMKFSERVRHGSGSLIFLRPGRMRWDYIMPDHQVIISDGVSITMYFEKNNQMIISDAKDYLQSDVTYSFFTGTGDILQDFHISEPDFENLIQGSFLIKLVPKSAHPHVSKIHAWISSGDFLLKHLQIVDHFDTVTDLYFENVRIDSDLYDGSKISENLFFFTPPDNTEIIRQH
jgi:outer membrane lipoprotein carrier protein